MRSRFAQSFRKDGQLTIKFGLPESALSVGSRITVDTREKKNSQTTRLFKRPDAVKAASALAVPAAGFVLLNLAFYVIPMAAGVGVKYPLISSISLPLILVVYEVIGRLGVLRFLFGMRQVRNRRPEAAPEAS